MQSSAPNTSPNNTSPNTANKPPESVPRLEASNRKASTAHPFAHSTAKLELIPNASLRADGIDIEAEARLYDELCGAYEDDTENVRPLI